MKHLPHLLVLLGLLAGQAQGQTPAPRLLPFQARLTEATGQPLPDGARVVQFQIFGEPAGGTPLWAGEVHRVTLNGGLVNVMLGSRNPLPNDRADDPARSFFDATLYLQVTPDANADDKITEADPPLMPRQAIVPVLFAAEAGRSRNSDRLAGHDWSTLLGVNDPVNGRLPGAKLADGSVTDAKLAAGSVTSTQIADGTVGPADLAKDSVGADTLAAGLFSANTYTFPSANTDIQRYDTGRKITDWYPVLSGFDFGWVDLQENSSGQVCKVHFADEGGNWIIYAGIRAHIDYPDVRVWVLWIPRRLVAP